VKYKIFFPIVGLMILTLLYPYGYLHSDNSHNTYDKSNISFNYPTNWFQVNHSNVFGEITNGKTAHFHVTGKVPQGNHSSKETLSQYYLGELAYYKSHTKYFGSQGISFNFVSSGDINVNGQTGHYITLDEKRTTGDQRLMRIFLESKGRIYTLYLRSTPSNFEDDMKDFQIILDSFKIN